MGETSVILPPLHLGHRASVEVRLHQRRIKKYEPSNARMGKCVLVGAQPAQRRPTGGVGEQCFQQARPVHQSALHLVCYSFIHVISCAESTCLPALTCTQMTFTTSLLGISVDGREQKTQSGQQNTIRLQQNTNAAKQSAGRREQVTGFARQIWFKAFFSTFLRRRLSRLPRRLRQWRSNGHCGGFRTRWLNGKTTTRV